MCRPAMAALRLFTVDLIRARVLGPTPPEKFPCARFLEFPAPFSLLSFCPAFGEEGGDGDGDMEGFSPFPQVGSCSWLS